MPFDERSNKTVIYFARDAYVSIGYTGLAYLDGRTTDQWIAEKLLREDIGAWGLGPSGGIPQRTISGPMPPWFDIGMATQVLRRELIASVERMPLSQRAQFPKLIIAGWQHGRRLWRPILIHIGDSGSGPLYREIGRAPRRGWEQGNHVLAFTPWNRLHAAALQRLNDQLALATTIDEAEHLIGESLRIVAHNGIGIGKDYLSVCMPFTRDLKVRTTYSAFDEKTHTVQGLFDSYSGPVGYSPWFVGPFRVMPPAVLVGATSTHGGFGDFVLELKGPPATARDGYIMAMASQGRPIWPGRPPRSAITMATWVPNYGEQHDHQPAIFKRAESGAIREMK